MKEKWDETRKAKEESRREKEKKKVKTTVSHWKPRTISKFFFPHMLKLQKQIFRIWVRRPLLFIYLFIYWHFIFVSLVRIRIPMQVKQKASNRYVSEITQTIIICETFDYVIWWSTLIIKKVTEFFVFIGLGLLLPVFVIVLKGIKFFEQCTWPKADFFSFISSGFSQVLGQIGHLH